MRRKIGIRILSVLFTAALAIAGILIAARVTMRTDSDYKTDPFLQEDTDVDVLFLGTSHVINGIFPMQLWEDYGITSYNLGGHGITIATSYWILRNAIEVHKPKVAVLDVSLAESEYLAPSSEWAHDSLDAFPLTKTKIQAVQDLYPDDKDHRMSSCSPLCSITAAGRSSRERASSRPLPGSRQPPKRERSRESRCPPRVRGGTP